MMTREEQKEMMDDITCRMLYAAQVLPPQVFKGLFSASVANVVGNLSEEYWAQFVKCEPCGREGCRCHLETAFHAGELFKLLRGDHEKNTQVTWGVG